MTKKQLRKQKKRKKQKERKKQKQTDKLNIKTRAKNIRNECYERCWTKTMRRNDKFMATAEQIEFMSTTFDYINADKKKMSVDKYYAWCNWNKTIMLDVPERVIISKNRRTGRNTSYKIVVSHDFKKYEDEMIVLTHNEKFGYHDDLVMMLIKKNEMWTNHRVGFYLFEENTMIGFAMCSEYQEMVMIEFILIAKEYRRKGYGEKLLNCIKNEMGSNTQVIKKLNCEIDRNNIIAKKLFIKNKFKLDTSENPVVLYRARVNPHLEQYTAGYINQKDSCSAALNLLPSGKELEKEKKELLMNMMMTVINTPSLHKEFLKMVEEIKKEG